MDPISHLVFGPALIAALPVRGRARADRDQEIERGAVRRGQMIAAAIGAIAPDIDAVLMPAGWDVYLRAHEIGTHTLAGSLPLSWVTAVLVGRFVRGARWSDLARAAWIGCVSHIGLDLLSGARIQVGWPLVSGRLSAPLVAMAEPWVIAVFVAAALLWLLMRDSRRLVARWTIAVLAVLFAGKAVLLARALTRFSAREGAVVARVVEARWAHAAEWYVVDRRAGDLRRWSIAPGRDAALLFSWPLVDEPPVVARSREMSTVRNFLSVHELGFAGQALDPDRAAKGGLLVLWSDLRFCRPPAGHDDVVVQAAAPASMSHDASPVRATTPRAIACELWFGGRFDSAGQPLQELVKVGGWWQPRPLAIPGYR